MKYRHFMHVVLALTGFVAASLAAAASQKDEAVSLLREYIRLDTSNPPGNELQAAKFFKAIFDREGIEARVIESAPGRANVYARLRSSGSAKAVLLLHHMDVVPADKRHWAVDPFAGTVKDGYVWGRGALDMKGMGVVHLMTMLSLKRKGIPLAADIIFLGVADEEEGGRLGTASLINNHFDLLKDTGVVLNEGGYIAVSDEGKVQNYRVETSQKVPLWLKLTATGEAGHSSAPRQDSAVTKLVNALQRIANYQTPLKVEPIVQKYYADTAHLAPSPERQQRLKDLQAALRDPIFASEFVKNPGANAVVRNTVAITMLQGAAKINVLPSEASAQLDVRLLPSEQPQAFINELRKVIDDDSIRIEPTLSFAASSSPSGSRFVQIVREVARRDSPGAVVTHPLITGFTDCHYFREVNIPCYGFLPFKLTGRDVAGYHGKDERLSVNNLEAGMRLMYEIVEKLAVE